jgi:two-component system, OmpR family, sensor histidine kinase ChvG
MSQGGFLRRGWRFVVTQFLRIRVRLLVINLIAMIVPLVGIQLARTFERESLNTFEKGMRQTAEVVRTFIETGLVDLTDSAPADGVKRIEAALVRVAKRTRLRIRLLNKMGHVRADSHRSGAPEGPEPGIPTVFGRRGPPERRHAPDVVATDPGPLYARVEIAAARRGELGTATRIHKRIERVFLFLALPVMKAKRVTGIVYVTRSTTPVLASMHRIRRALIRIFAIATVITLLLSIVLAASISRPLGRLRRAAVRIAAGDRSASIRLNRRDEIGDLARAYHDLLTQLNQRANYISEFAANISHEFKTPLSSIRGAAELVLDDPEMPAEVRQRFMNNVLADTKRLDRLVSRLLELSRIEATLQEREPIDLVQIITDVVEGIEGREVVLELPASAPFDGHRAHIVSALRALVENAIRHSPEESPIRIALTCDDVGALTLRIEDSGCGISEANQKKIFDRFFTTEAESGGTGLGLAIVKSVIDAHGGSIHVESEVGQGSVFEIVLP